MMPITGLPGQSILIQAIIFTMWYIIITKKGLLKKKKWYLPNTNILDDEVFFTYNTRGDAVRQQSFIYGVDAHIIPDAKGNYTRYDLYIDGNLVQTGLYTFNRSNKNPWTAMKGIPYGLPGYAFQFSKWWETSETIIFYDEEGNPYYYYDQNPSRTRMRMNDQDYLLEVKTLRQAHRRFVPIFI